ncbi:MAG: AAA family ATPase, partial [Chloroflexota bacterium]|nr:AAA family ATPase [Chloroflexota bacterium]
LRATGGAGSVEVRAAVMTGEAAVAIGAEGQGMVAGDLVNTASRLQSVAPPGGVLVGEATYRATRDAIAYEPVATQALKGKSLPVAAWQAQRVVSGRRGAKRAERLETPFVGRDSELRLLKELFHATSQERRTRLALVSGIAGIGKSRLAWELEKYLDGLVEQVYWHQGRSPAYGEGLAYWALAEMVRARAGIAETDDATISRAKLADTVREWVGDDTERDWVEPRLAALLALEPTPEGERGDLFAAWRRLFEAIAERGTVVLVFEDLHWADAGLLEFVESLVEWSRNQPILVIGLARPEFRDRHPDWGVRLRNFASIQLEPLGSPAMEELLGALIPGLDRDVAARIMERAEGVPLYAVETVRMLTDDGRLVPTPDGGFALTGPITDLEVPPSLHALIASRLDALAPAERAVLQDAAVLGQTFTTDALAALTAHRADDLAQALGSLTRKELLTLDADPRSPERGQYGFVQGVIREVAYGLLSKRDRRTRHLAAARHFESIGGDEFAGVLAGHYLEAYRMSAEGPEADAVAAQTRVALRAAADRSAALYTYDRALVYVEQALDVTTDGSERAELLERAGAHALATAKFDVAERHAKAALRAYEELAEPSGVVRATTLLGAVLVQASRSADAVGVMEARLATLDGGESEVDSVRLTSELARAYMNREQHDAALAMADRTLEAAARIDAVAVIAEALVTRGAVLMSMLREHEGLAVTMGAVALAERHGFVRPQLRGRNNAISTLIDNDPAGVIAQATAGIELAERLGQRDFAESFEFYRAVGLFLTGEWDTAYQIVATRH